MRNLAFFGWRLIPKCFTEINDKVKIRNWVESMGNHLLCMFSLWVLQRGEKHFRKGDAAFFQQLVGRVSFWYYHRWYSQFMDLQMKSKRTMFSKIPLYFSGRIENYRPSSIVQLYCFLFRCCTNLKEIVNELLLFPELVIRILQVAGVWQSLG